MNNVNITASVKYISETREYIINGKVIKEDALTEQEKALLKGNRVQTVKILTNQNLDNNSPLLL